MHVSANGVASLINNTMQLLLQHPFIHIKGKEKINIAWMYEQSPIELTSKIV